MKLRERVVLWMVGSLVVVLGATGVVNMVVSRQISDAEIERSARFVAANITEAMSSFGEIGDMDGLHSFIEGAGEHEGVVHVSAFRGPTTVAEYGERPGGEPRNPEQMAVLRDGEIYSHFDKANHVMRYVMPVVADESCLDCHDQSARARSSAAPTSA